MKSNRKMFFLIEGILGILLIIMVLVTIEKRQGEDLKRIAVLIQNSDENRWSAFKYGLKMAAQDEQVDVLIVNCEQFLTAEEEIQAIESEISKGADAVIVEPVEDESLEDKLEKIKVPVLLLSDIEEADGKKSKIPVVEPNHYEMGKKLAEELLKDNRGNLSEKRIGIFSSEESSRAVREREKGVREALAETKAEICWSTQERKKEGKPNFLKNQEKVDYLLVLDNESMIEAGEAGKANELHGAVIYGIGASTEAVYYLDTGNAECLIVPDEFNTGYESVSEMARFLKKMTYHTKGKTLSCSVIRRETLFSEKNQQLLFMMSQ